MVQGKEIWPGLDLHNQQSYLAQNTTVQKEYAEEEK